MPETKLMGMSESGVSLSLFSSLDLLPNYASHKMCDFKAYCMIASID